MTEIEKIIAGITNISDYNINFDFETDEAGQLLEADIVKPADFSTGRASDLIIDEIIDYKDYPFEDFPPDEQLRQLNCHAIEPSEFLEKIDLELFDADDWLYLLQFFPLLADCAPREMIRQEGKSENWKELLEKYPHFSRYAPENTNGNIEKTP